MKLRKISSNFTQVSNIVINDKRLSWKAKGVYAYLYSKPEVWDFSGDRICSDSKDGRKVAYSALKELENTGYLRRHRLSTGKIEYILEIDPNAPKGQEVIEPTARNGKEPKRPMTERGSISNTDNTSNTEKESNKEKAGVPPASDDHRFNPLGADILKQFVDVVDVKNKSYYGNKTQREACDFLIKEYGFELVLKVINLLPKTNKRPRYEFPYVSTPHQLKEHWQKLSDGLIAKKVKVDESRPKVIISAAR